MLKASRPKIIRQEPLRLERLFYWSTPFRKVKKEKEKYNKRKGVNEGHENHFIRFLIVEIRTLGTKVKCCIHKRE